MAILLTGSRSRVPRRVSALVGLLPLCSPLRAAIGGLLDAHASLPTPRWKARLALLMGATSTGTLALAVRRLYEIEGASRDVRRAVRLMVGDGPGGRLAARMMRLCAAHAVPAILAGQKGTVLVLHAALMEAVYGDLRVAIRLASKVREVAWIGEETRTLLTSLVHHRRRSRLLRVMEATGRRDLVQGVVDTLAVLHLTHANPTRALYALLRGLRGCH